MGGALNKNAAWTSAGLEDFKFHQVDMVSFEEKSRRCQWRLLRLRRILPYVQLLIDVMVIASFVHLKQHSLYIAVYSMSVLCGQLLRRRDNLEADAIINSNDVSDTYLFPTANFKRCCANFGEYCLFKRIDDKMTSGIRLLHIFIKSIDQKFYVVLVFAPQLLVTWLQSRGVEQSCRQLSIAEASLEFVRCHGKLAFVYVKVVILAVNFAVLAFALASYPVLCCIISAKMKSLSMGLRTFLTFRVDMAINTLVKPTAQPVTVVMVPVYYHPQQQQQQQQQYSPASLSAVSGGVHDQFVGPSQPSHPSMAMETVPFPTSWVD